MIEVRAVTPAVKLVKPDPYLVERIWLAFRTCYSSERPEDLWNQDDPWDAELPERTKMMEFVQRRMLTEHTTPLEQAVFQFTISGVSRVFTHQFVRHRVGMSVGQQSGRYTDPLDTGVFEYVEPASFAGKIETNRLDSGTGAFFKRAIGLYEAAVDAGVPREDARFLLPNCQATNLTVTINFTALQHMCDIRLCTLAQWEFRKVVALMRAEVKRHVPELARFLGPKCMAGRRAACDEDHAAYRACPLSTVRPHRDADIMHGVLPSTVVGAVSQEAMEAHLDREAVL